MAKKEDTIKTRLQFDGEDEYKKAVASINSSLYTMSNEMKLVTAQFADNAKSTEALTAKQEILQRQYAAQAQKVEETKAALARLEAQEVRNDKAIAEYRNKLLQAQTALAKTGNELNAVERDLAAAGDETDNFTQDLKEAGDEADKSGSKFSQMGSVLGEVGKAFGSAVAAIGAAAVAAGSALVAMTVAASDTADELLTQAAATRQTTEDLQKYAYAANFVDVSMDTLTGSMQKNIKAMDSARSGTGSAAEAYAKLGISVTNADGTLRNSNEVYWEVIDALRTVENETERDVLAMDILGKSASDLNTVINAGSEAFKAYGEEAERMGAVMSDQQIAALGAFNDKLQQVKAGLGGLKNTAALIALPFLDTLAGDGVNILAQFSKGIQECNGDITKMGDVVGSTLGEIVNLVTDHLPELIEMGVNLITALVQGIVDNADVLAAAAVKIVDTLVKGLKTLLPMLLQGAVTLVQGLAKGIAEQLPTLIPVVVEMILTLVQGIAENIPLIVDAALMIVEGLVDGIIDALPVLIDMLPTLIVTIVNGIIEALPRIFSAAARIITTLIDGLVACIPDLIASIPYIITGIIEGITNGLPQIMASANEIIISLINGLIGAIPQLVASIPQIITAMVEAFVSGLGNFFQIGVEIVKGLWEGIKSMFSTLWENIKGFFGGIVDGVKSFLGIHSPSTVFASLGEDMAAGIGVGFADEMKKVTEQIQDAIPTEFDTESEIVVAATPAAVKATENGETLDEMADREESAAFRSGGIIQVTQNIYTPQYDYAEQQRAAEQQLRQLARAVV